MALVVETKDSLVLAPVACMYRDDDDDGMEVGGVRMEEEEDEKENTKAVV